MYIGFLDSARITLISCALATLVLDPSNRAPADEPPTPSSSPSVSESSDSSRVQLLPERLFLPRSASDASRDFLQSYYDSIEEWGRHVLERVEPVPGHSDWRYLGLKRHVENDLRPTAYAAMVLSFLSEARPPESRLDSEQRDRMRAESIGLLRYLTASHVTGGGACQNGKPWGNQWQSAMWARAVAMAAWQMWPRLDGELRSAVVRMVEYEADRFIGKPPKSSARNDTGAEENAWNAAILSLACNMAPEHPRGAAWERAAKTYMYNTFSVRADAGDPTVGDDGKAIRDWVSTVNAHDDFTVENHGLVHVGYLKNSACELQENAVHWLMVGKTPPRACDHHLPEVFEVLLKCMNFNGSAIYFAGNDWRVYQTQCTDVILYCMLNLLSDDARAAYLERIALKHLRQRQRAEGGFYNVRRDLEYGGLCASRLIACYYAHSVRDSSTAPLTAEEFDRETSGVRYLASARTVLHRTPRKFASFTWAQKRMALAIPRNDSSVVWPHFASYLGIINGEDSSYQKAKLANLQVETSEDGFRVSGELMRCSGNLRQDFFYASPAGEYTVYVERLRAKPGFRLESRETGVIGMDYGVNKNTRVLYGAFGEKTIVGQGGKEAVYELKSDWINLDNQIGYIIARSDSQENLIRFHDKTEISGRRPHLQEWLSLVGENQLDPSADGVWSCVVTFLNQNAKQTQARRSQVRFDVNGASATCTVGGEKFIVDFSGAAKAATE